MARYPRIASLVPVSTRADSSVIMRFRFLIGVSVALFAGSVSSGPRVQIMALFPGKVMLTVNGNQRLLSAGQSSPEGVKLISADSREAVLEIDGQIESYGLGSQIETSFKGPELAKATVWRDRTGTFTAGGSINGKPVNLLLDTGASMVAMSSDIADRLAIPYRKRGTPARVLTASGATDQAYGVVLDRVRIGEIELPNVEAVVIEGSDLPVVLLGLTFLNRVKIEHREDRIDLEKAH